MDLNTAHPTEIIIFVMSTVGMMLIGSAWRLTYCEVQRLIKEEINGMKILIVRAHERDETIRAIMMLCIWITSIMMLRTGTGGPMQIELIYARVLLIIVTFLITLKSYLNLRDRDHLQELQDLHRQRKTDVTAAHRPVLVVDLPEEPGIHHHRRKTDVHVRHDHE